MRAPATVDAQRLAEVMPVTADLARRHVRVAELDLRYRDQVVARYTKLGIPVYWAGINSMLTEKGSAVEITYPKDAIEQYLSYGAMYDSGLKK